MMLRLKSSFMIAMAIAMSGEAKVHIDCDHLPAMLSGTDDPRNLLHHVGVCMSKLKDETKDILVDAGNRMALVGSNANWFHLLRSPAVCSQINWETFQALDQAGGDVFFSAWMLHCYHPSLSGWIQQRALTHRKVDRSGVPPAINIPLSLSEISTTLLNMRADLNEHEEYWAGDLPPLCRTFFKKDSSYWGEFKKRNTSIEALKKKENKTEEEEKHLADEVAGLAKMEDVLKKMWTRECYNDHFAKGLRQYFPNKEIPHANAQIKASAQLLAYDNLMRFAVNGGELHCGEDSLHLLPLLPGLLAYQMEYTELKNDTRLPFYDQNQDTDILKLGEIILNRSNVMHWSAKCLEQLHENSSLWARMELLLHEVGQGLPDEVDLLLDVLPTLVDDATLLMPLVLGVAESVSTHDVMKAKFVRIGAVPLQSVLSRLEDGVHLSAMENIKEYLRSIKAASEPLPLY